MKKLPGQVEEFHEEFKEFVEAESMVAQDEELEAEDKPTAAKPAGYAQPDDKERTPAQTKKGGKKQVALRQSDMADQRETEPEYMQRLEQYKRGQEELRLKHENFLRRQQEAVAKRTKDRETKERQSAIQEWKKKGPEAGD